MDFYDLTNLGSRSVFCPGRTNEEKSLKSLSGVAFVSDITEILWSIRFPPLKLGPAEEDMRVFSLVVLLDLLSSVFASDKFCDGRWIDGDPKAPLAPFLGMNRSFETFNYSREADREEFKVYASCPVEVMVHSCFYQGMTEKSNMLMRRKWQLTDLAVSNGCVDFEPKSFLESMKGRHLHLSGDSTMSQLWQAVICRLLEFAKVPAEDIHMEWLLPPGPVPVDCPAGKVHCAITPKGQNTVYFRSFNASITVDKQSRYYEGILPQYVRERRVKASDVFIYNFGLHYGAPDEDEFLHGLKLFLTDVHMLRENKTHFGEDVAHVFTHNFYFLESFPQNFEKSAGENGYFHNAVEATGQCAPVKDLKVAHDLDWRSRRLEEHLTPHGIPIIKITDGLRSQWDAHIGADSKMWHLSFADCTHYCNPSKIFDYVLTQIMNSVDWKE